MSIFHYIESNPIQPRPASTESEASSGCRRQQWADRPAAANSEFADNFFRNFAHFRDSVVPGGFAPKTVTAVAQNAEEMRARNEKAEQCERCEGELG